MHALTRAPGTDIKAGQNAIQDNSVQYTLNHSRNKRTSVTAAHIKQRIPALRYKKKAPSNTTANRGAHNPPSPPYTPNNGPFKGPSKALLILKRHFTISSLIAHRLKLYIHKTNEMFLCIQRHLSADFLLVFFYLINVKGIISIFFSSNFISFGQ